MESVDEESGAAQDMALRSLFPCFLQRSYALHSRCLSLTHQKYGEVNLGTRNYLSGAGKDGSMTEWSDEEHSRMQWEETKEVEYYDLSWVTYWRELPEEDLSYM